MDKQSTGPRMGDNRVITTGTRDHKVLQNMDKQSTATNA